MDFGAIIREARTSSGLSQAELGNRTGVSVGAIYELEVRGNGTVALLTKLCTGLDLRLTGLPRRPGFPQQVRALRTRRGWSQEKLAAKAGVSAPAIMRLERGQARISTLSAALKVLAPEARIRKPELAQWRAGTRDKRFTPKEVLDRVADVIGAIDLDPAAHRESRVLANRYYFEEDDGLKHEWSGRTVFCNPPYSHSDLFLRKAFSSWRAGQCKIVFLLLPVRTHTRSFHRQVVGLADVFFLEGRISFEGGDYKPTQTSPFGNMVVLFGADDAMIDRMLANFDCVHLLRSAAVGRRQERESVEIRVAAE